MTTLPTDSRNLYLDLLKRCLLGMIYEDPPAVAPAIGGYRTELYVAKFRETGRDVPSQAHSMIGLRRMNNLQACIEQVLADGVPGDLIETGVWRGGATIFMRGVLKAYGITAVSYTHLDVYKRQEHDHRCHNLRLPESRRGRAQCRPL